MKKLLLGVNYYPEDWDESYVDSDIGKMLECGFNVVRIAEFAWKKIEPKEGEFSFEWLHTVVDKMHRAGIGVILGTPTATPPHWLFKKYPDMATLSSSGVRTSHGGRRHCCSSHPEYNRYSAIIVEKMAKEFGNDPGVIGWQIDNEIYHWEPGCSCEYCQKEFHTHLEKKYKNVESINAAWNLNLFSQAYDRIDDIPVPINAWHNPHIILEWNLSQFNNHMKFVHMQADILKKYTKAPIGTDTMPFNGFDYRELNSKLDVAQFNHYSTDLSEVAMWMDYMKHFSRRPFWNTETQACWNGSTSPGSDLLPEGFIYLNTWLPIMLGGEANLYWLWRTHWAGHELMHGAVLDSSGRYTYANGEIRHAAKDFTKVEDELTKTVPQSDTALMMTSLNWNIKRSQEINRSLHDTGYVGRFYKKLLAQGVHPDVIDAKEDLMPYKLLFTPSAYTLEEGNFIERVTEWVKNGGVWVVGPLTDIRTAIGTKYKSSPYGVLEELLEAKLAYILPHDQGMLTLENECGHAVKGGGVFELFEDGDFKSLLKVKEGHKPLIGKHAAFLRRLGKGAVIMLGTLPEDSEFLRLIAEAVKLSGAESYRVTPDVMVTKRVGEGRTLYVVASLTQNGGEYIFEGKRLDLLSETVYDGKVTLDPYQIYVLTAL